MNVCSSWTKKVLSAESPHSGSHYEWAETISSPVASRFRASPVDQPNSHLSRPSTTDFQSCWRLASSANPGGEDRAACPAKRWLGGGDPTLPEDWHGMGEVSRQCTTQKWHAEVDYEQVRRRKLVCLGCSLGDAKKNRCTMFAQEMCDYSLDERTKLYNS